MTSMVDNVYLYLKYAVILKKSCKKNPAFECDKCGMWNILNSFLKAACLLCLLLELKPTGWFVQGNFLLKPDWIHLFRSTEMLKVKVEKFSRMLNYPHPYNLNKLQYL